MFFLGILIHYQRLEFKARYAKLEEGTVSIVLAHPPE